MGQLVPLRQGGRAAAVGYPGFDGGVRAGAGVEGEPHHQEHGGGGVGVGGQGE
jgi:hypothetical protein